MNALSARMLPRSRVARRAAVVLTLFVVSLTAACADKVFRPRFVGTPRMTLRLQTTAAQVSSPPKFLELAAVYTSTVSIDTGNHSTGIYRIVGQTVVPVTGSSQQVSLKVDLSTCLTDGTRTGSPSACSLSIVFVLKDSVPPDSTSDNFFRGAYDVQFLGPFDATPGNPPVIPPVNLSLTRFAVHDWVPDEALRLGGAATPLFFSGRITGVAGGASSSTLFALTQGNCSHAQLAIFQNGTWRRVDGPGTDCTNSPNPNQTQTTQFNDVAAFAVNDVYIAAQDGLYHYDGTAITPVSAVRDQLVSVGIVSASGGARYLAAGTNSGAVWFGNLTSWQKYTLPSSGTTFIDGVCVTGPTEAFASSSTAGGLFRFDGTSWTSVPASTGSNKIDLQCLPSPPSGQAYVNATQNSPPAPLKWNGSSWSFLPTTGLGFGRNIDIAVSSPTEIWAVGDSASANRAFYRFDGIAWQQIARRQSFQPVQRRPWANPLGGEAFVASGSFSGRVERVTASGVTVVSYQPSLKDAVMTSASSAFAVGSDFFLSRFDGTRWTVDAPPPGIATNRTLQGVWSDGPGNAWAVGASSTVVHWDGAKWNVVSGGAQPVVSPGDNYNAVWGAGGSVWIAGAASILRCTVLTAVTNCSNDAGAGTGALFGIWGTSATSIFAVGAGGRILQFNGTSWTTMASPTSLQLSRVWGTGPGNVYAVGDGVMVHFDGKTWQNVPLTDGLSDLQIQNNSGYQPSSFQLGLWGTGPNEIYVGAPFGQIVRYDGFLWSETTTNNNGGLPRVVAITGFAGGCAIAVTDGQNGGPIGGSTLMRGVGPSGCLSVPMTPPTSWP